MEVVDSRQSILSNYEVHLILKAQKESRETNSLSSSHPMENSRRSSFLLDTAYQNALTIEYEVSQNSRIIFVLLPIVIQ